MSRLGPIQQNQTVTRAMTLQARCGRIAVAAILAVSLGGCAMDEIEFNGGLFEMAGLGNNSRRTATPQMEPRSGIVVPPSTQQLPPPGSNTQQQPGGYDDLAAINDPDQADKISQEELARRQKEYCDKHYEPARQRGDESAASIEGPAGPCRKSVLTAIKNWNNSQ